MNILVLKDWNIGLGEFDDHWDGIMAAFNEISRKHSLMFVTKLNEIQGVVRVHDLNVHSDHSAGLTRWIPLVEAEEWDVIICWGSLDRPWHNYLDEYSCPKILCHAGGPTDHPNNSMFDVFCCESQVYIDQYKALGKKAVRAFGTNTKIFYNEPRSAKVFDSIYPASFCFHKNHELYARAVGPRGLTVGNFNEQNIVGKMYQLNTPVMGRVSSETLRSLYNMSRTTVIPCGTNGGAQRVVLESMACGVPVIVAEDNDKCVEFVEESGFGRVVIPVEEEIRTAVRELCETPMDPSLGVNYVKSKWTEYDYAMHIMDAVSIARAS